jgi:hypothetical protein
MTHHVADLRKLELVLEQNAHDALRITVAIEVFLRPFAPALAQVRTPLQPQNNPAARFAP